MQMTDNFSSFYRVSFRSTIIHPCSTTCSLKITGRSFRYESPPSSLESTSVFRLISSAPSVIFFFTFLCTCHLVFIFIHHPLLLQSFTPGCPSTNNSRRRLHPNCLHGLLDLFSGFLCSLVYFIGLFLRVPRYYRRVDTVFGTTHVGLSVRLQCVSVCLSK